MGYSVDDSVCRVDLFKPSGKWSINLAVPFKGYDEYIFDQFKKSLVDYLRVCGYFDDQFIGYNAVCLEPYNKNAHPLMITITEDMFK